MLDPPLSNWEPTAPRSPAIRFSMACVDRTVLSEASIRLVPGATPSGSMSSAARARLCSLKGPKSPLRSRLAVAPLARISPRISSAISFLRRGNSLRSSPRILLTGISTSSPNSERSDDIARSSINSSSSVMSSFLYSLFSRRNFR